MPVPRLHLFWHSAQCLRAARGTNAEAPAVRFAAKQNTLSRVADPARTPNGMTYYNCLVPNVAGWRSFGVAVDFGRLRCYRGLQSYGGYVALRAVCLRGGVCCPVLSGPS